MIEGIRQQIGKVWQTLVFTPDSSLFIAVVYWVLCLCFVYVCISACELPVGGAIPCCVGLLLLPVLLEEHSVKPFINTIKVVATVALCLIFLGQTSSCNALSWQQVRLPALHSEL